MKVAITGASGQLGKELQRTLSQVNVKFDARSRNEVDISNSEQVSLFLDQIQPNWLVNCAAYTNVDLAEDEIRQSLDANAIGPQTLARNCRERNIRLIHISTDSVFSADEPKYFGAHEKPNPINQYGKSKMLGEKIVLLDNADKTWIVRTSWLYGDFGGQFVHNILRRFNDSDPISVVNDQFGQPTYTKNIANYIYGIMLDTPTPGIYHFADSGYTSRFGLAKQIISNLGGDGSRVIGVKTRFGDSLATRPIFSLLDLEGFHFPPQAFNLPWTESLAKFTDHRKEANSFDK